MKQKTWVRSALILAACGVVGCSNADVSDTGRRDGQSVNVGGTAYSSVAVQEQNVFGVESSGISNNPLKKPSEEELGDSGIYAEGMDFTIEPEDSISFINEIIEYTIQIDGEIKKGKPNFVIQLEGASGANGSLVPVTEYVNKDFETSDNKIVATTESDIIKFRVMTGNAYNNKGVPMYYINVWQADHVDEDGNLVPVSTKLFVKRPAQVGDEGVEKGIKDIENDLSTDEMKDELTSKLTEATFTLLDSEKQQLYLDVDKKLGVQLTTPECTGDSSDTCTDVPAADEAVCWKLVEQNNVNNGSITTYDGKKDKNYSTGDLDSGKIFWQCGKTDKEGKFNVEFNSGTAYNARYYINYFHKVASPVTYTVDTFALPKTLGVPGSDAVITDSALDVSENVKNAETNSETGKKEIKGCDAAEMFSKMDDETIAKIEAKCGSIEDCEDGDFTCKLVDNGNGSWSLQDKDGNPVQVDLGNGEGPVNVVVATDDNGKSYVNGIDTDGDGKTDIPVDPSKFDKSGGNAYAIVCSDEKDGEFGPCTKVSADIDEVKPIYVKLKTSKDKLTTSGALNLEIIANSDAQNNAAFTKEGGPTKTSVSASDDVYQINFWAGTAYDAQYFIYVKNDEAKSAYIPVVVRQNLNLPTAEGDEASLKDAQTPPADLGEYNKTLGPVKILIASGFNQDFTIPIINSADLKILVVKDNGKDTVVPTTKTWWKISRGDSINNNGNITKSTIITNSAGEATNSFYAGTGYNSLYYVSVFHPNYTDASDNPIPFIFSIKTQNSTGSVDGPGKVDIEDQVPEGDSTDSSGKNCKEEECDTTNLDTVNGQKTNPSYPQGPGCGQPDKDGNVLDGDSVTNGKVGCLELQVLSDTPATAMVGSTYTAKVKLVWRNGDEVTPIKDTITWTLNKGEDADGELLGTKTTTNKNTGEAMVKFKTGSKKTTYKINAMYANIHDGKNMIPKTMDVAVIDVTSFKDVSHLNTMDVSVDTSELKTTFDSVNYYVFNAGQNACGQSFIFNPVEKRKTACEELKHSEKSGNACDLSSSEASDYKVTVDNRDAKNNNIFDSVDDGFTVYAVANDESGNPIGYSCEGPFYFDASTIPSECPDNEKYYQNKKDKTKKYIVSDCKADEGCAALMEKSADEYTEVCMSTRSKSVKIKLAEVPLTYPESYKTKTVVNLGPLMGKSSQLSDALDTIAEKYNQFIGEDPGKKVTDYITENLIIEDTSQAATCLNNFFSAEKKKCCDQKGTCQQAAGNLEQMCTNNTTYDQNGNQTGQPNAEGDAAKANIKTHYTECNCVCASLHYWAYESKLGKLITPLAIKGIQSLVNKYLGNDTVQDLLCGTFDSIQFVTLTGNMTLKKEDKSNKFTGNATYSGMEIPFTSESFDLGASPLKGTWREASVANGENLTISDYVLNFTYGEFIYAVLGKVLGIFDEETGRIDIGKALNCEKLFSGGLSLPIVGSIDSKGLVTLCNAAFSFADKYAFDFAVSKTTKLSLKLQGTGEFTKGERGECSGAENKIGCVARNIENGTWEGTGSLGEETADGTTSEDKINGAWVAYTETAPEIKFGTKDLQTYMSENSLCRQKIKEDAEKKADGAGNSNKGCLMGTFDNPSQRATNNLCSNENCKTYTSVVVCNEDGTFNQRYANATEAQIIKAANDACKAAGANAPGCNSSDIINGGKGVTNEECYNNCDKAYCQEANASIVVCGKSGNSYEKLSDDALNELCGTGTVSVSGQDRTYDWSKCAKAAEKACAGNCNSPGCVMNSDIKNCAPDASNPDAQEAVEDTKIPEVIASWDFTEYAKDNAGLHSAATGSGIQAKEGAAKTQFALKYTCEKESQLNLKIAAGTDGTLKAVGTRAVNGMVDKNTVCYFDIVNTSGDSYVIEKVEYTTMDAGRTVYYKTDGGTPTGWSNSGSEWHKTTIDIKNSDANGAFKHIKIWPTIPGDEKADYNDYKMMRLDDIKVWGVAK